MRFAAVLAVLFLATPAAAGLVYDFVTKMETSRGAEDVSGRVWVEGNAYRAEVRRGSGTSVVISRDGDATATFLNPEKRTWSNRARVGSDVRSASLFLFPMASPKVKGKPLVRYRREETATLLGHAAVPHVIEAAFDVESRLDGASVRGKYRVVARVWTIESLPALPLQRDLRTGYAEVDRELAKIAPKLQGMVVRNELEVTRALGGGIATFERTTTRIVSLEEQAIDPLLFEVPATFTYSGPATTR